MVETTSGGAVGGGFVVLVGMDGKEITRTMADRAGLFTIRAPAPGQYRLRSERIGFRLTLSEPIQLNAGVTVERQLDVAAAPIRLDEMRITAGDNQCRVRPEDGRATAMVWDEARKALAAVAWSQRQSLLKVTIRTFEREVEPDLTVKTESTQTKTGYTSRPFHARPAALLASEGYVQATPDSAFMFYAPDADVLFSEEFLNTHCLRVEPGGTTHPGRIGLAFEPTGKQRAVAEIRGVMWLDERSAELETVEFQYVNTKLPGQSDRMGGRVDFQQLVNGVWVVDHWYIRMPMFGMTDQGDLPDLVSVGVSGRGVGMRSAPRRTVEVVAFREEGGEVMDVFDRDGQRLAGTAGATLSGSVFDSTRTMPLIGATVRLIGTGRTAESGPGGQFRMDRLPQGTYQLEFLHPDFPAWGVLRPGVKVTLERGVVTETRLAVPPADRLFSTLCPGVPADSAYGAAGGIVTSMGTGLAIAGAKVQVTWKRFDGAGLTMLLSSSTGLETATDAAGYFRVCGIPAGELLSAQVVIGERATPPFEFRVGKGEVKELNLLVPKL